MPLIQRHKKVLYPIILFVILFWLGGCTTLPQYVPTEPMSLTPDQQDKVGASVELKLLQLLGGPYYDKTLVDDLNQLAHTFIHDSRSMKIAIADRNAPALYLLPGDRIIMSRGLLAGLNSQNELENVMSLVIRLSGHSGLERMARSSIETAVQLLSATDSAYDPDSAAIRLARDFEQHPCEQACLDAVRDNRSITGSATAANLPESVRRLKELQPVYELLASAREFEKSQEEGKAIAIYLQAAAAAPDEPYILGVLGLAYLRAGQLQSARLHLQKAVKMQPDYYRTLMGLGYVYLKQGQISQADELLLNSVRRLPVVENLFLLAEAREKGGDIAGSRALYKLVIESDGNGKLGRTSAERLAETSGAQ
jgi:predicted Zn-dependent protease